MWGIGMNAIRKQKTFRTPANVKIRRVLMVATAFFLIKLGVEGIFNTVHSQENKAAKKSEQPVRPQAMQENQITLDTALVMPHFRAVFDNISNLQYLGSFKVELPETVPTTSPLIQICDQLSITQTTVDALLKSEAACKGPLRYKGNVFYLIYEKKTGILHVAMLPLPAGTSQ
jgi:hypothetical protein